MRKRVIVTGGGRGLGADYCRHLASKCYDITIIDLSPHTSSVYGEHENVNSYAEFLRKKYQVDVDARYCDLCNFEQSVQTIDSIFSDYGSIHAVIANAGGDIAGEDTSASGKKPNNNSMNISILDHHSVFKRNFDTTYNVIKASIPHFRRQRAGRIITVSSVNATFGVPSEISYSVSKGAVIQLTRCVATELRQFGVSANCVIIGPTKTARFMSSLSDRLGHDLKGLNNVSRLDRVGTPSDISPVIEFLLCEASEFMSGSVLKVDGGLFNHAM